MGTYFLRAGFIWILLLSNNVYAQSANMSITLLDALTFTVNQPDFLAVDTAKANKNDHSILAVASDHISVVSSRGYIVKAISGNANGLEGMDGMITVSSQIGTSNQGNVIGLTLESDVKLPSANGNPATVITASNCSWNGPFSTNKFNIAYKIGNEDSVMDKNKSSVIPVIYTVLQP